MKFIHSSTRLPQIALHFVCQFKKKVYFYNIKTAFMKYKTILIIDDRQPIDTHGIKDMSGRHI